MTKQTIGICAGAIFLLTALTVKAQQIGSPTYSPVGTEAPTTAVVSQATAGLIAGAVPRLIQVHGVLRATGQADLSASARGGTEHATSLTFALYELQYGGSPLWLETQSVQLDEQGGYTVLLGNTQPNGIPVDLFSSSKALWLSIQPDSADFNEQPRVLLVAVPYALKAADADTLGGLPPSAFLQAGVSAPAASQGAVESAISPESEGAVAPNTTCSSLTSDGTGTANQIAKFSAACNLEPSAIYESGGKVGIGTKTPAANLDVKGTATLRGTLTMNSKGAATSTAGTNSYPVDLLASSYDSAVSTAITQHFRWQAEPTANNTATPGGALNLLYASGSGTPFETGLSISNTGILTFATGQTFPGAGGGITGVTAGTDLTGGGTSGSVTLNLDTTKVPQLATANTFAASQTVNGTMTGTQLVSTVATGTAPLAVSSTTQVNNLNASLLGGLSASNFQTAGSYATLGANTFSATQSISNGDLSVNNGNIDLPVSSGSIGLVKAGGYSFLHSCCNNTNAYLGVFAGNLSGGGSENTAVGYTALGAITSGQSNSALGIGTLKSNTTGSENTAMGDSALVGNNAGSSNTAVGADAAYLNTSGSFNTAVGNQALYSNTTATENTAVGDSALHNMSASSSTYNTAIGAVALYNTTTGQWNTAIGGQAAEGNTTGSYNTFIGANSGPGSGGLTNATAIGYGALVDESNALVLGGSVSGVYPTVGIGTNNPNTAYILDVHGNLNVTGAITAGTKDFKIDDPIDPKKNLYHASIESSEMKNLYDGVTTLNGMGRAVVKLPDWFEALNGEFRYQLTAIGRSAPGLYIAREIHGNQFEIAGGKPGMKVSWMVTGIRHDDWAKAHPLHVEELKSQAQ